MSSVNYEEWLQYNINTERHISNFEFGLIIIKMFLFHLLELDL